MLTEERIEEYVSTLRTERGKPAGKDLKRKTRNALRGMMAILLDRKTTEPEHEEPDERDYTEYRESSLCEEKSIDQDIKRIRRYFAPQAERSDQLLMIPEEEMTAVMNEPEQVTGLDEGATAVSESVKKRSRRKGEKRVQVSVYLDKETHETLKALSSLTHESIGDMIAKTAKELAKKNAVKANEILKVLQGFTIEY